MADAATRVPPARALPPFPWDTLAEFRRTAEAHPDGLIDLSVGAPVDRVPGAVRTALADASDAPGYPPVAGRAPLREAYTDWLERAHGVTVDPADVLPTIGSKEFITSLAAHLGWGPGDTVVIPDLAYPSYQVGAQLAGAEVVLADPATLPTTGVAAARVALVWLNSPSNPTGAVIAPEDLAQIVAWARGQGAVVASDECYLDLGWEATPLSILHPDVCGGDHTGLLAVHSLSKRSNMAGYRLGFVTGDPALIGQLTAVRRHAGLMVPAPIQAAGVAALGDDAPMLAQRHRYAARRETLRSALERAGFTIDESVAGLYLWCTRGEGALATVAALAERGILVAPGTFYGPAGARHIRVALTASDAQVTAAATRLAR